MPEINRREHHPLDPPVISQQRVSKIERWPARDAANLIFSHSEIPQLDDPLEPWPIRHGHRFGQRYRTAGDIAVKAHHTEVRIKGILLQQFSKRSRAPRRISTANIGQLSHGHQECVRTFNGPPTSGGGQSCNAADILLSLLNGSGPLPLGIVVDQDQGRDNGYQHNQDKTPT